MLPAELLRFTVVFFFFFPKLISPVYLLVYFCTINRDFVNNYVVYKLDFREDLFSKSLSVKLLKKDERIKIYCVYFMDNKLLICIMHNLNIVFSLDVFYLK